ncbi:MAG: hypothetical protein JXA20_06845 [Spirochaetes bacterium]|nr:hypothetical protein [Spirochaetota bacterium]
MKYGYFMGALVIAVSAWAFGCATAQPVVPEAVIHPPSATGPTRAEVEQWDYADGSRCICQNKYDAAGRLTMYYWHAGGGTAGFFAFVYDSAGRLVKRIKGSGTRGVDGLPAIDKIVHETDYEYGPGGRLLRTRHTPGSQSNKETFTMDYSYDSRGRVVLIKKNQERYESYWDITYRYDSAGNCAEVERKFLSRFYVEYTVTQHTYSGRVKVATSIIRHGRRGAFSNWNEFSELDYRKIAQSSLGEGNRIRQNIEIVNDAQGHPVKLISKTDNPGRRGHLPYNYTITIGYEKGRVTAYPYEDWMYEMY